MRLCRPCRARTGASGQGDPPQALAHWLGGRFFGDPGSSPAFVAQHLLARPGDAVILASPQARIVGECVYFVARSQGLLVDAIRRASSAWQFVGAVVECATQRCRALIVGAFDGEAFIAVEPAVPPVPQAPLADAIR